MTAVAGLTPHVAIQGHGSAMRTALASCLGVLVAALVPAAAAVAAEPGRARFQQEAASREVRKLADWIVDARDNRGLPFVVVDKTGAKVFVFNADGGLRGAAPALLGSATGDDSAPGIGTRPLAEIRAAERTTPAGRFVAALGRNMAGGEIVWVDYAAAISLHPVVTTNPRENRARRLASPTPLDNRISYGCINVPRAFFRDTVSPALRHSDGIVYVLPETRTASELFGSYDVDDPARPQGAGEPVARR